MELLTTLLEDISFTKFDIGSWHWVIVTHINNPNDFFVRLISHDKYMPGLETKGDQLCPHEAIIGCKVIYESKILKSSIRGQITKIHKIEQTYDIFAEDYGYSEKGVHLENICKPFYYYPIPPLAMACSLTECHPLKEGEWAQDSIEAMKDYVGGEKAKLVVRAKNPQRFEVELINSHPSEIGTLLALTGFSKFSCGLNSVSRFTVNTPTPTYCYKYKKVKLGEELYVRLQRLTQTCEFYVTQVDDFKEYTKEKNELHQFAFSKKPLTIEEAKVGMPVASQPDIYSSYERGIIKEIYAAENKLDIRLVDWGHVVKVDVSTVKPMNSETFIIKPAIAIYCSTFLEKDTSFLNNIRMTGTEFTIKIKHIGNGFQKPYVVSIENKNR